MPRNGAGRYVRGGPSDLLKVLGPEGSPFHSTNHKDAKFLRMDFIDDPEGLTENLPDAWVFFFGNHPSSPGKFPDMFQG
jgi:hypothetical protein